MADCDYCDESFDDEEALLGHMRDAHEGDLGRIDRRRVADLDRGGDSEFPTGPIAIALIIFISAAVVAYVIFGVGGAGGDDGSFADLPEEGNDQLLSDVESFQSEGNNHVDAGTEINYARIPPTSGPHYGSTVSAGFYEEQQPLGALVHSLEHGAVVVYYDPAALDSSAEQNLKQYANTYTGHWSSVVVVPNPREIPQSDYVLTAWRHRILMDGYDEDVFRAFLAEYLGRGPENPVR